MWTCPLLGLARLPGPFPCLVSRVTSFTGAGLAHGLVLPRLLVRMATSCVLAASRLWPRASVPGLFLSAASVRPSGGESKVSLRNPLQTSLLRVDWLVGAHLGVAGWWVAASGPGIQDPRVPHGPKWLCHCVEKDEPERGCESEHVGVSPRESSWETGRM